MNNFDVTVMITDIYVVADSSSYKLQNNWLMLWSTAQVLFLGIKLTLAMGWCVFIYNNVLIRDINLKLPRNSVHTAFMLVLWPSYLLYLLTWLYYVYFFLHLFKG